MNDGLRGRASRVLAPWWVLGVLLWGTWPAHAQLHAGEAGVAGQRVGSEPIAPAQPGADLAPLMAPDGLRGGRNVGSSLVEGLGVRAAVTLGYAHTEGVFGDRDSHHRTGAELSAAWVARPWLQLALRLDGRYDTHDSFSEGKDSGFAGSTELSSRHAFEVSPKLSLAAQARLRFPAAQSVARGLAATTTELAALGSFRLRERGEVSGTLGYRFERSDEALTHTTSLSKADLLAASISRFDAVLLGALLALPLGPITAIGEWSWDLNVGADAPAALKSPMRLRFAVQTLLGEHWIPGIELGLSTGKRPELEELVRIEPRVWCAVSLGFVFDRPKPPPAPAPVAAPPPPEPEAETARVELLVTDPEGSRLAGAVVDIDDGRDERQIRSGAEGRVVFEATLGDTLQVHVAAPGHRPFDTTLQVKQAEHEQTITLERELPEGEIKGKVRSLRGGPLRARIEVLPLDLVVETGPDGDFRIDVPPGDYRLRISAEGHDPQERSAQVERLGVTILVVDLRRTPK